MRSSHQERSAPIFTVLIASALALLTLLACTAAPALAKEVHLFKEAFGEPGSGSGQLSLITQSFEHSGSNVAINEESGDVYVTDTANGRVSQFEADGTPVRTFGTFTTPTFIAVDNSPSTSAGDVYVVDSGAQTVSKFDSEGNPIPSWGTLGVLSGNGSESFATIAGIAVTATGDLAVFEVEPQRLLTFSENGGFIEEVETPRESSPVGLAIGPEGDFYKANGTPNIEKFAPSGARIGQVTSGVETTGGLAVDSASGDLYVSTESEVLRYHFNGAGEVVQANGTTCALIPATAPPFGGCAPSEAFGAADVSSPAGPAIGPGHVAYLANAGTSQIAVFATVHTPTAVTGEATGLATEGDATLNGTVDPEGVAVGECRFEYGPTAAYGSTAECTPFPGSGTGPEATSAAFTGLAMGRYHYRLSAVNANGEDAGNDHTVLISSKPALRAEALVGASATTATIGAQLNPGGLETTYSLEYGPTTAYGLTSAATGAGAGLDFAGVQATLAGLSPGTVYHARLTATNDRGTVTGARDIVFTTSQSGGAGGESSCPNRTFSGFSPLLPDCRAYEYVSGAGGPGEVYIPAQQETVPNAEKDIKTEEAMRAAAAGAAVVYVGEAGDVGGSGLTGRAFGNQFLARRNESQGRWEATNITPLVAEPEVIPTSPAYEWLSADLSAGIFPSKSPALATAASPQGPANCQVLYQRSSDGVFHALFTETQTPSNCGTPSPPESFLTQNLYFAGGNAGTPSVPASSHLLFQSPAPLAGGAEASVVEVGGGSNLYQSVGGLATLVSVLPGGEPDANATYGAPADVAAEDGKISRPNLANVISADGSRIFWTDLTSGRVYERLHGSTTVPISEGPATYRGASTDGRFVLYTEAGALLRFDTEAPPGSEREALAGAGAGVQGLAGASEDGSYVYFVAEGALSTDAESRHCLEAKQEREEKENNGTLTLEEAERLDSEQSQELRGQLPPGRGCNVYLRHAGETILVAALSAQDNRIKLESGRGRLRVGVWQGELGSRTAQVADGGRELVFQSTQQLTKYDNSSLAEARGREFGAEVFVFHTGSGQLLCASCDPSGAPPAPEPQGSGTYLPVSVSPTFMPRWVSADGSRVFFASSQPLTTQDTNGIQDVYEWEQAGTPGCPIGQFGTDGCVSLLSGGDSSDLSFFIDASADGRDVFFTHRGQLGGVGSPEGTGVIDARADGGFVKQLRGCTGADCRGTPSSAPPSPEAPSSEAFNGPGNLHRAKHKHKKKHRKKHTKSKSRKTATSGKAKR